MNDERVTEMVREAARPTDAEVETWDIERELDELLAGIAEGAKTADAAPRRGVGLRPRLPRLVLGGIALACALAAAVALIGNGGGGGGPATAFAQDAIRVAEANPRILIGEPGWGVESVDQFERQDGGITFARGDQRIGLDWRPAAGYKSYTRSVTSLGVRNTEVLGTAVPTYGEDGRYRTVIPPINGVYVEIYPMTVLWSPERWQRLLDSLERVDLETWLSAMPPEAVMPSEADDNLEALLEGVPVPPGFSAEQIDRRAASGGERNVAATVTYVVTCAWFDEWAAARQAGDDTAAAGAVTALQGYDGWSTREQYTDGSVKALGDLMADSEPSEISKTYVDQQLNCIEYR